MPWVDHDGNELGTRSKTHSLVYLWIHWYFLKNKVTKLSHSVWPLNFSIQLPPNWEHLGLCFNANRRFSYVLHCHSPVPRRSWSNHQRIAWIIKSFLTEQCQLRKFSKLHHLQFSDLCWLCFKANRRFSCFNIVIVQFQEDLDQITEGSLGYSSPSWEHSVLWFGYQNGAGADIEGEKMALILKVPPPHYFCNKFG